jgi:hypothetical protein
MEPERRAQEYGEYRVVSMSAIRSALLACGLGLALAVTVAWDSFVSYEFFRFAEFMF